MATPEQTGIPTQAYQLVVEALAARDAAVLAAHIANQRVTAARQILGPLDGHLYYYEIAEGSQFYPPGSNRLLDFSSTYFGQIAVARSIQAPATYGHGTFHMAPLTENSRGHLVQQSGKELAVALQPEVFQNGQLTVRKTGFRHRLFIPETLYS